VLDKVERVYAKPPYSPFPRAEYENRVRRLKEEMVKAELDVVVMWGENNIRYFTGFLTNHFPPVTVCPGVLIVAVNKEPVMIVPNFFQGVVEGFTFINDIRIQHNPHVRTESTGVGGHIYRYGRLLCLGELGLPASQGP
jgi:hypothetical protein